MIKIVKSVRAKIGGNEFLSIIIEVKWNKEGANFVLKCFVDESKLKSSKYLCFRLRKARG